MDSLEDLSAAKVERANHPLGIALWLIGLGFGLIIGGQTSWHHTTSLLLLPIVAIVLICFRPRMAGLGGLLLSQGFTQLSMTSQLCGGSCGWFFLGGPNTVFNALSIPPDSPLAFYLSIILILVGLTCAGWAVGHDLLIISSPAFRPFYQVHKNSVKLIFLVVIIILGLIMLALFPFPTLDHPGGMGGSG